ncbi:ACBD3 family protein [Megaselia abdita]
MDSLESHLNTICLESPPQVEKWMGFSQKELYTLAFNFYKEKNGKAFHLSYEDNTKLVALTHQAKGGSFDPNTAPQLGVLDVIGKDRRVAWQSLGNMSKEEAIDKFIELVDKLVPSFSFYIEAVKTKKQENFRLELEEKRKEEEEKERKLLKDDEERKEEEKLNKEELQRRQLQDALNQQTYHQFKAYAEKQFPGNPEQQAVLIRQLQNEHYHQYMQQLHSQITVDLKKQHSTEPELDEGDILSKINTAAGLDLAEQGIIDNNKQTRTNKDGDEDNASDTDEYVVISPARMWTRPDIKAFKSDVSSGSADGVIVIGHGDTVTVRVPTHEGGNCIFWEFATDNYDIGFGVYFEWSKPSSNEVTVHVSESDDDEYYDDTDDQESFVNGDLESGGPNGPNVPPQAQATTLSSQLAPVSIIVPIYRRECQNEVYVGSHPYPGEGTYLLKFDNSFSVWRSKTLYYRIYYER